MPQQMPQFNLTLTTAGAVVSVATTGAAAVYISIGISLQLALLGIVAGGLIYYLSEIIFNACIGNASNVTIRHEVAAGSASFVATIVSAVIFDIGIALVLGIVAGVLVYYFCKRTVVSGVIFGIRIASVLGIVAGVLVYYFCKRNGQNRSFENTPSW